MWSMVGEHTGLADGRKIGWGLSALSLWAFPSPSWPGVPFYLLRCTWLVYFVRTWELKSRPLHGEVSRLVGWGMSFEVPREI